MSQNNNNTFYAFISYPEEIYKVDKTKQEEIVNTVSTKYNLIPLNFIIYDDGIKIIGKYELMHDIVNIADEIIHELNIIHLINHEDCSICYLLQFHKTVKNATEIDKIFYKMQKENKKDDVWLKLYMDGIKIIGKYNDISKQGKNMFELLDGQNIYGFSILADY